MEWARGSCASGKIPETTKALLREETDETKTKATLNTLSPTKKAKLGKTILARDEVAKYIDAPVLRKIMENASMDKENFGKIVDGLLRGGEADATTLEMITNPKTGGGDRIRWFTEKQVDKAANQLLEKQRAAGGEEEKPQKRERRHNKLP